MFLVKLLHSSTLSSVSFVGCFKVFQIYIQSLMLLLSSLAAVWLSPTERAHYVFPSAFPIWVGGGFWSTSSSPVWPPGSRCGRVVFSPNFHFTYIFSFLFSIVEHILSVFVALDIAPFLYLHIFNLQGALLQALSCPVVQFNIILYIFIYTHMYPCPRIYIVHQSYKYSF